MEKTNNQVTFKVFRFDPGKDRKPYFKKYLVPVGGNVLTVLDGLYYIQQKLDGSLAFRSSCRAGVCGSCAMHINGKYRLACNTPISFLNSQKIVLRPLGHLKIQRDLVVNLDPFWEKYELIKPYLMPGSPPPEKELIQSPDDRARINILVDCILCACCYSSCTITLTDKNYLGPAALLQMNRFVQDSRDGDIRERLLVVNGDDGAWRCHTMFNCQIVCPKSLNPSGSIADLKRKLVALNL